ncbi:CIA30 family protein [Rheinheimera fenheensis]|uniref:CIA30 family protein n=1 Tax=Rheinheimera fenheensis TaxID=3152295 RepID=UPI00325F4C8D
MTNKVQLNFRDYNHFERIVLIHDTVMGGRSSGTVIRHNDDAVLFTGNLSLENNGGFASAEFKLLNPITALNGTQLILHAKPDNRTYQLRLKTALIPQGVAYVAEFSAGNGQQTFVFTPDDFSGRYRGNPVLNLPPLHFSDISHVSIMLADKTPGPFQIALYSLSFNLLPPD